MKHIIILGDGMADQPIDALQGRTPLQAAKTPYLDLLASLGRCGKVATVPQGFHPGSEIANLTLLGYDVRTDFEGRGSLEAASMQVDIPDGWLAFRCNLICIEEGKIKNHSAGHISSEEAFELIDYLNRELGNETVKFHPGVSYRHLLLIKGGVKAVDCIPPHDVTGTLFSIVLPQAMSQEAVLTAQMITDLILRSQELLSQHPINLKRQAAGSDMANSIWPWSPGYKPKMEKLTDKFGFERGSVISAVDLIKGIGIYAGLESIEVQGATGLFNTNYEGKVEAALEELRQKDFVFLHIEASDEAGHEGDVELKVVTIENLDQRIVKPIYEEIKDWDEPVAIAILPDHPTPCMIKTHTADPVPFIIYKPNLSADEVDCFDEFSTNKGYYGLLSGQEFIRIFMND